ncbi:MAG TPA: PA14 domain-containing protein, partial [Candidatus Eisenbacteria bacterium]
YSSSDANTKMNQFQSWWNANQSSVTRDLAHLMTGTLNNGQLGVAYYSVLCNTSQAYGVSNSTWTSNWANRVATMTHEVGHNWGATHCNSQADCAIMCTNIGLCSGDMSRFSPSTIREIETYRNQSGACLAAGTGTPTALNPTTRDDRAVALRGTAATISVLANDFDPNCQTITVGSYTSPTANGGTVTASGDNLLYTPAANFIGTDTFQYTARDAGGAQSTATVTVEVQDYKAPDTAAGAVAGLQVRYYNVPPLDGSLGSMPALSNPFRIETVPSLSIPMTDGVVGESGLKDKVAARFTGSISLPSAASYTFYLTASDGAKLYIDNTLRVDNDGLHGIQERSASVSLTAGAHDVRVDYYEETGTAGLKLELAGGGLSRAEIPPTMWANPGVQVAYYQLDSSILPPFAALVPEGTQAITTINYPFSWGNFAGSGRSQNVGAVYEGFLTVPTDNIYYFEVTSEDGSKFYIGDQLVIDNDGYHNRVAMTGGRALRAGAHKFRLDYFAKDGGCALIIQVWSSTLAKQVVPSTWWSHLPTYHVPTDYATIGAAIAAAPTNSMVWVAAGTYTGTGNKNLDLGGKNLTLRGGGGPSLTVLDAQSSGRLFNFSNHSQSGAVIEGFTISRGSSTTGAGGAMAFSNSTLTVRNCYIEGNMNTGYGGALAFTGTSAPTFDGCVISGNHSDTGGGAIFADAGTHPSFLNCTVSGNFTDASGGGVYVANGGRVDFDRSILWGNSATTNGSEAWTADAASTVEFNCSDVRSTAVGGGGSEVFGTDNIISDPLFCVPSPGAKAPTIGGGYRVVGSSPVLGLTGACGTTLGARGQGCTATVTGVDDMPVVRSTILKQNTPNPFNPVTRINFSIERGAPTTLRIFDVAGRLVATLLDRNLPAGEHSITWRGMDSQERQVATGVYFYELRSGEDVLTRSMVLLK